MAPLTKYYNVLQFNQLGMCDFEGNCLGQVWWRTWTEGQSKSYLSVEIIKGLVSTARGNRIGEVMNLLEDIERKPWSFADIALGGLAFQD